MKRCELQDSQQYYAQATYEHDIVLYLCKNDQHNYQSCGLKAAKKIGTPEILCNELLCFTEEPKAISIELSYKACKKEVTSNTCVPSIFNDNRTLCQQIASKVSGISTSEIQIIQCDMLCQDTIDCLDEANCNGFQYGIYCRWQGKMRYINTYMVCNSVAECDDLSDERGCIWLGDCLLGEELNHTRCGPLRSYEGKYKSYCQKFRDQYNCSDPHRGLLRCEKDTFPSTVSYGVICKTPWAMCDDEIDMKCQQTSEQCLLHKHLLCNHRADCQDGSDENITECQNFHFSTCHRRYVLEYDTRNFRYTAKKSIFRDQSINHPFYDES